MLTVSRIVHLPTGHGISVYGDLDNVAIAITFDLNGQMIAHVIGPSNWYNSIFIISSSYRNLIPDFVNMLLIEPQI